MIWFWAVLAVVAVFVLMVVVRAFTDINTWVRLGRIDKVTAFLEKNPELIRTPNADGELPIHHAASCGEIEMTKFLLERGSELNAKATNGATSLHFAAACGELEMVQFLLERRAEIDPKDNKGFTPIMIAKLGEFADVVEALKAAGADDTAVPPMVQMAGDHFISPVPNSDPLMMKAIAKAREQLGTLRELQRASPDDTMVKVPFTTDTGVLEHLWGDVLELTETQVKVRIRTMPTAHEGRFQKVQTRPIEDIEDWQVEQRNGTVRGGFGYQVMFLRTREQTGTLPAELLKHEKRFVDHDIEALMRA